MGSHWMGDWMIIRKFLEWSQTATVTERARAAGLLARAYLFSRMTESERRSAEAAMMVVLDDSSPKVRLALAEALATSAEAPREMIRSLAGDQIEIASRVLATSPVLSDADLVDFVADGRCGLQRTIASRQRVSASVCAAIAEVGHESAVCDMLDNPGATVASISLRRIAERFGDLAGIRSRLLDRTGLPCDVRYGLIFRVSQALADYAFVTATVGAERVRRVAQEACQSATLELARSVPPEEMPALVEHLRVSGKLTPALLVDALCTGNVEFFAAAIVSLSGYGDGRVRGILADGRRYAIRALYRTAGLPLDVIDVFVDATLMWREAMTAGKAEARLSIPRKLIELHGERARFSPVLADLLMLIEKMELAGRRQAARDFARSVVDRMVVERAA